MNVSRPFKTDFDLVVEHYACPPDEVEQMKTCARADMESAQRCFAAMAEAIAPERAVNRRLRERLQSEQRIAA